LPAVKITEITKRKITSFHIENVRLTYKREI
jgi:hypothetical protein